MSHEETAQSFVNSFISTLMLNTPKTSSTPKMKLQKKNKRVITHAIRLNHRPESNIISAIKKGFFQQVRFLVHFGSNVNLQDAQGQTALILCSNLEDERWSVGIARTLLEHGAKAGIQDKQGRNALHHAVIAEKLKLVKVILTALDFDLLQSDRMGSTALMDALKVKNEEIAKLIIETHKKFKVTFESRDSRGRTALQHAYLEGLENIAVILESIAGKPKQKKRLKKCRPTTSENSSVTNDLHTQLHERFNNWSLTSQSPVASPRLLPSSTALPLASPSAPAVSASLRPTSPNMRMSSPLIRVTTPRGESISPQEKFEPNDSSYLQPIAVQGESVQSPLTSAAQSVLTSEESLCESTDDRHLKNTLDSDHPKIKQNQKSNSFLHLRSRSSPNCFSTTKQEQQIKHAGHQHLHNRPDLMFQVVPADCFSRHYVSSKAIGVRKTRKSTSWKSEFLNLFSDFEYQCSESFKPAAVYDASLDIRVELATPVVTEETISEQNAVVPASPKRQRKPSRMSTIDAPRKKLSMAGHRARRISTVVRAVQH